MSRRIPILILAAIFFAGATAFSQPVNDIGPVALQQIAAIQKEKETRTPAQRKMDFRFIHQLKSRRGQLPPIIANIPSHVRFESDGRVLVDIDASVTDDLIRRIEAAGGTIVASVPKFNSVRARISMDALESLAALTNVTFIKQAVQARTRTGSVESQGDITHGAVGARTNFGVNGAGIKVGVLSDSVKNLATSQSTGDLPPNVTVLPGQSGTSISGNEGEGTAMLEIIHDLAPGAQLYFATAFASEASFAQNILALRSNGCNIIVDDVGYFDEPVFQDGLIAQAVNSVTSDGALYFSSAGNGGRLDAGTAANWEGDFVDGGAVGSPMSGGRIKETGRVHNFGANTYDVVQGLGANDVFDITLFWADPWGASTNDYDLFALNSSGTQVDDFGAGAQNGTQNPYEICTVHNGDRIVIVKYIPSSGTPVPADRFLHLELEANGYGTLSVSTPGNLRGHNAATNAFAVAAVDVHNAYPNLFNSSNTNEYFSSDGPRKIFFHANGTPITPGNFTNTGGAIRLKPDISAADGASNSVSGFNPFFGTSAAAPHAAACAALLWSYNPSLTLAQMRAALINTAIDIASPGWDRNSGWGIVMPGAAIQSLGTSNHAPVLAFITNKTIFETTTLTFTNLATDSDGNVLTFSLDAGFPSGSAITTNGIFSWTPTETQGPSTNAITVRVTDNGLPPLSATQSFTVFVLESNLPPVLSPISNKTNYETATIIFTNSVTDADIPANALTFDLATAPTNASIDALTGVFQWTPDELQGPGNYTISVRVTDNGAPSLSATQTFTVMVLESNEPPVLSPVSDKIIFEQTALTFTNFAADADWPTQNLVFSLDAGAPTNAALDATSGIFSWTPTEIQGPSTNTISIRVTDNGTPSLSATQSFTVVILESNSSPVLAPVLNRTIHAGSMLIITNSASDADIPANVLSFSLTNSPASAVINSTNGILIWTPDNSFADTTNNFTVNVTDDGIPPLSDSKTFSVTVIPPPAFLASQPVSFSNDVLTIYWSAIPGQTYAVQTNDNLGGTNWANLLPDVTATNSTASKSDVILPSSAHFYRVVPVP